ncbi:DNA polymerase III subunit beta [Halobacteriovorax marinus]|uniref:Beta sliding clamp n=1 Tax=Halobacteriovorax marinus TaxID=97084 RepID=A0A1Y5F1Z7_9BACT|nr:DNA polymerase III subunit beta [Halobacteriovorax marinus]
MKIKLHAEDLKTALNKVLSVVDKRNSRPILTYTLIEATNEQLNISATDLEVSAKVVVNAHVDNPGKFCVNAKNIFDILKELPGTEIELSLDDESNTLKLNCGDIHYSLLIYKADDFPHLLFNQEVNKFTLSSEQLTNIINKTSYAVLNDETRLYLNGIYLQEIDSKLRAVATDGHRLSLLETDLSESNNETLINGIIIPRKGIYEIKKVSETYPEIKIELSVDDTFLYINAKNEYFLSVRLIAREYPKYQAVIPNKTTYTMTTDRNSFFDAIRRIKIMSNEKSNGVRLKLSNQEMTLTANHPSLGEAMETMPVDYNGKDMEIGFNAKYLIDTLQSFDEGEISLELNNELSPIIIKSNSLPNYLGIIMPLKL